MDYTIYLLLGLIIVPGYILAAVASAKVNSSFKQFSSVRSKNGITAFNMVRSLLIKEDLREISIIKVSGTLTDYYDNKNKQIALSEPVINSTSLAALGVAAHEFGHALQYKNNYFPIKIRRALIPVVNFTSNALTPIILLGLILGVASSQTALGELFAWIGIVTFGAAALFHLVTLPTEFNASKRAVKVLVQEGILQKDEIKDAKKVLNAAALTYVAAFALSLLSLLRFVLIIYLNRRRR